MAQRQNDVQALKLLIAQRRLYSRAKRWLGLRWAGMLVIGIAAPVVSIIIPALAVWARALAGLWLFLGQTLLTRLQVADTESAAAVQELFDLYVFAMPPLVIRSVVPSPEDIAVLAGPDGALTATASKEKLLDWYPLNDADAGFVSVAISQRANVSYADRLLRTTARFSAVVTAAWFIALIVVSTVTGLSLLNFLAGVVLPVLPSALDVVRHIDEIRKAGRDRGDLARTISDELQQSGAAVDPGNLLVWQGQLFDLRTSVPQVPNFVYSIKRKVNEQP